MQGESKSKIKVVHLITLLELGGAQGNTIFTVQNLNPERFISHLWTGKDAYWDNEVKKILGATGRIQFFSALVRQINPLLDLIALWKISKELKKLKPEILHTHSSKAGILGRIAGRISRVPVIIHTYHGFGFNDRQQWLIKWMFIALERWTAHFSTKLIFVSKANMELARHLKIGHPEQYQLIRSGIPLKIFKSEDRPSDIPNLRGELGVPAGCPIVLTVGPFKPQKNLIQFLEVAKEVSQMNPQVHFVLVGDGALRKDLEEKAVVLKLSDKVHMPGWRKDVVRILSISKVFAITSLWEGLPRALVEAMSAGVPAVCYKTDGVKDLLSQGGGVMVSQGDIKAMAQAIAHFLSDQKAWEKAAKQEKDLITNDFDINFMVKQQEELYEQLLKKVH